VGVVRMAVQIAQIDARKDDGDGPAYEDRERQESEHDLGEDFGFRRFGQQQP
jgi:hypothetical protein